MKRIFLIIVFFFAITSVSAIEIDLPSSYLNRTADIDIPNIDVISLKYEPFPVEPGEYFTLWLRIQNLGNDKADNALVEVVDSYPFSIQGNKVFSIGSLGSRQEYVLKIEKVKVDESAVEGDNELEVLLTAGGAYKGLVKSVKLKISVQSVSPILDINVISEPEIIEQGSLGDLILNIKNLDNSVIEDISVKLNLPDQFVPIGSTTEKKIDKLLPGKEDSLIFRVISDAGAATKAYKIPFEITYFDEIGNKFSKNDTIGILIGSNIDYIINVDDSDVLKKGSKGSFTISISNTGPSDMKFVILNILPSKDYEIIGKDIVYLGNLESDDFESSDFEIFLKKSGNVDLILELDYKDSFNKEFTKKEVLKLRSYSGIESRRLGIEEAKGKGFLLVIILIIIVYIVYRQWRREKDIVKALKNTLRIILIFVIGVIIRLRWGYIKRIPRKIRMFLRKDDK